MNFRRQVVKEMRSSDLIWIALGSCTRDDDDVGSDAGRGDSKGSGCGSYIDSPETAREGTAEKQPSSINGRGSIALLKYQVMTPLSLCCRLWLRTIAVPRTAVDAYQSSDCSSSIARKAESGEAARLAKGMGWTLGYGVGRA